MKLFHVLNLLLYSLGLISFCQAQIVDSLDKTPLQKIQSVNIVGHFQKQPLLGFTSAGEVITYQKLQQGISSSLLPALNQVAGLKMEERSPGSYRIALRGNMLRSPFGVRNTKVYYDEFSLTDAGGNTYINLIDPLALSSVHVIKGPDGSIYGANSGGVIRLEPVGFQVDSNSIRLGIRAGSYDQRGQNFSINRKVNEKYSFALNQSYEKSEGYRNHSALEKFSVQTTHKFQYAPQSELRFLFLYTDLYYQTPGGLTEAQWKENPRASRPAAGPNPSAEEQNASIHNKTLFSGISNRNALNDQLSLQVSVFGSYTDFTNPFITNYENRYEYNGGFRAYLAYENKIADGVILRNHLGVEGQKGWYSLFNYDNLRGIKGDPQNFDELRNTQFSYFNKLQFVFKEKWHVDASLGLSKNRVEFDAIDLQGRVDLDEFEVEREWMPRIASSYLFNRNTSLRASVSKGFSPPTLAEIRPSNQMVNQDLKAESGTNYELGFRFESANRTFIGDISVYQYDMKNGIVRQVLENGNEEFQNSGELSQKGVEISIWKNLWTSNVHENLSLDYKTSISYQDYEFLDYVSGNQNFSGNRVTAVPEWMWNNSLFFNWKNVLNVNILHNYTSSFYLNDANTVSTEPYHLLQSKLAYNFSLFPKNQFQTWVAIDNILDENYSLGNDINAFGNRFYNPAPNRNYSLGIMMSF